MYKLTEEDKEKLSGRITTINCFDCGSQMRIRLARKGRNAGNLFLGCSNFPNCRGSAEMPEDIEDLFEEDPEEEFTF